MRLILLICLLIMTACTVPGQAESIAVEQPAAVATPLDEPVAEPTNEPTTRPTISPTTQPTAVPLAEGAVLLLQWNREQRHYEVRPVNPARGESVGSAAPISLGGNVMFALSHTLSADGRWLAAIESNGQSCEPISGGNACRARADALHLVDVATWQAVTAALPGTGWAEPLAFSPDSTRLALAYHEPETSTLLLFDTASGQEVAQRPLDFRPALLAFSGDESLALAGAPEGKERGISEPGPLRVLLLDGKSLADLWQQPLPEIVSGSWCIEGCGGSHEEWRTAAWTPAVAMSPDGHVLHIVHADDDRLTTVDLAGRSVSTASIKTAQSWLERLLALTAGTVKAKSLVDGAHKSAALSPDGERLYLVGKVWQIGNDAGQPVQHVESQGLQVIDPTNGRLLESRDTQADRVRITPDGVYLLLDGWDQTGLWTEIVDANSLETLAQLNEWEVTVALPEDGDLVLLASRFSGQLAEFAVLQPPAFAVEAVWSMDGPASWLAP